ncbi:hypothetical protein J6590_011779 [Homalodisca vitripennis]|nr:hypothetical protein J6590_011779 [Homalodisca vitripennis]
MEMCQGASCPISLGKNIKDKDKDGDPLKHLEGTFTAQAEGGKMTAAAVKKWLSTAGVAEEKELQAKLDKLGTTLTFQQFHDILKQLSTDKNLTTKEIADKLQKQKPKK